MKNERFRSFMLILYLDDETHKEIFENLKKSKFNYAWIIHNQDKKDDDTLKKEHVHFFIRFQNGCTISALSKKIGLAENYIEPTKKNYIKGLRYLIHADDKDKYQYDVDEVHGPLTSVLVQSLLVNANENDYMLEIIRIIESSNTYITYSSFAKKIANLGYWSYYRKSASIINNLIKEHNSFVIEGGIDVDENLSWIEIMSFSKNYLALEFVQNYEKIDPNIKLRILEVVYRNY